MRCSAHVGPVTTDFYLESAAEHASPVLKASLATGAAVSLVILGFKTVSTQVTKKYRHGTTMQDKVN